MPNLSLFTHPAEPPNDHAYIIQLGCAAGEFARRGQIWLRIVALFMMCRRMISEKSAHCPKQFAFGILIFRKNHPVSNTIKSPAPSASAEKHRRSRLFINPKGHHPTSSHSSDEYGRESAAAAPGRRVIVDAMADGSSKAQEGGDEALRPQILAKLT